MTKLSYLFAVPAGAAVFAWGCGGGSGPPSSGSDAGDSASRDTSADVAPHDAAIDGSPRDGAIDSDSGVLPATLTFKCAETTHPVNPNPCPAPSGKSGEVDFCYRAEWAGVTSVEVYGGFGQATDWTTPFLTLTNDGTGTFTGSASIADGSYPYLFRTSGSDDNLVSGADHYFNDQENPNFEAAPAASPSKRSNSVVKVPQIAAPLVHLKGTVAYQGVPESCFSVDLEAGELVDGSKVVSEHGTANYTESAADGTFDFPVAAGAPYMVVIRYPFLLSSADAGYPDPNTTPSVGTTRTTLAVGDADTTLNPADIAYPLSAYAAMSPTGGTATLPVAFTFTVLPGSSGAQAAVISTDIAGNDPAYSSGYSTKTSITWSGAFNGMTGSAKLGTKYYWGAWQQLTPPSDAGVTWTEESFLFPITFH
jgi:hypothetical protein